MKSRVEDLREKQKLSLQEKERLSEQLIIEWYDHWNSNVYVSFSGGKDSTVLLHLVRDIYPNVQAVFADTGLEFPEIRSFVKSVDNVKWLKPHVSFQKVIEVYGYPVVSKEVSQKIEEIRNTKSDKLRQKRLYGDSKGHGKLAEKWKYLIDSEFMISAKCCDIMKKNPFKKFERESGLKPFIGLMASDSNLRKTSHLRKNCNSFDGNRPTSTPLVFWTDRDIWKYIWKYNIEYSKVYNKGYSHTGCMFCMFGIHKDERENRFLRMKRTHPKHHKFCIEKLGCGKVLNLLNIKDY